MNILRKKLVKSCTVWTHIYTSDWRAMLWKTMSFFKATLTPHGLWKKGCLGEEGEVELEEKGKAFFHRVGNWQTEAAVFYMILRKLPVVYIRPWFFVDKF